MSFSPHSKREAGAPAADGLRRVLLASYHFPPDAAVGALRVAKFARFLPEFGWDVHALTVEDRYREEGLDEGRLQGLEAVPVVRTRELPRLEDLIARIRRRARRGPEASGPAAAGVLPPAAERPSRETLVQRLKRWIVSLIILLPDEKKSWSLYAAGAAVRLIRTHRIACIVTSGPPFSVHVIGLAAKLFTNARWIADFRDPWCDMLCDRFPHTRSAASDVIERWMERAVIRHADRVVTTTERMRQAMAARYGGHPADRFVCVPNSIDTDRCQPAGSVEKYVPLTITYAGNLYFDRTPEPLFRAVGALIADGKAAPADIRIKLLGRCRYIGDVETRAVARRYGLEGVVEVIDRVPYAEAVRIMQRSHLLLMLAPDRHRLVVPAKLFDYLGSGSSILAIAERGATADLIDELSCGKCFSQCDVDAIRDYLQELIRNRAFEHLRNDPGSFSRYDARYVTGRLAAQISQSTGFVREGVMVRI